MIWTQGDWLKARPIERHFTLLLLYKCTLLYKCGSLLDCKSRYLWHLSSHWIPTVFYENSLGTTSTQFIISAIICCKLLHNNRGHSGDKFHQWCHDFADRILDQILFVANWILRNKIQTSNYSLKMLLKCGFHFQAHPTFRNKHCMRHTILVLWQARVDDVVKTKGSGNEDHI